MTNSVYILHDLQTDEKIVIKGYEAYIQFFTEQLKPFGFGTRYLFSEVTRVAQYYHLRLVSELNPFKRVNTDTGSNRHENCGRVAMAGRD